MNYIIAPDPITFEDGRKAYEKFLAIPKNSVNKARCGVDTTITLRDAKLQQETYRDNITKLKKDAKKRGVFEKNIERLEGWLAKVYKACGLTYYK